MLVAVGACEMYVYVLFDLLCICITHVFVYILCIFLIAYIMYTYVHVCFLCVTFPQGLQGLQKSSFA